MLDQKNNGFSNRKDFCVEGMFYVLVLLYSKAGAGVCSDLFDCGGTSGALTCRGGMKYVSYHCLGTRVC